MDFAEFKLLASELSGIDLANYKSQQMDRRINSLMQYWGIDTYDAFVDLLKTNPQKFKDFVNRLTINVSEFFRNFDRFEVCRQQIIPELLKKKPFLRIWSAGCSNGSEPYSIAIIIRELGAEQRVRITGSDVDREILNKARLAEYNINELKNLPPEILDKYFELNQEIYRLKETIKEMVSLSHQNLLLDKFDPDLDLIICRNVVIYFTEDAKNELYRKFYNSLTPGGYLWVGGTEPILTYRQMGFEAGPTSFYRKPGGVSS